MGGKKRFDRGTFDAQVGTLKADPRFEAAKHRFCHAVPASRLHHLFRHTLSADTGAFALGIAIVGLNRLNPVDGAPVKLIAGPLLSAGFASPVRVRALLDQMLHAGLIESRHHPVDRRRRKLVPTDTFLQAQRDWFEAVLSAVAVVYSLPDTPARIAQAPEVLERYLTSVMLRHLMDGFTLMDGMPEVEAFMHRKHGYLLLLELAGAEHRTVTISRTRLAEQYDVSASHIAGLLATAEARGWLRRDPGSSNVELSPAFADLLDTLIARELVIVGSWTQAKFGAGLPA